MRIILCAVVLALSALPAVSATLNCTDIELLRITPSSDPDMKQAVLELTCSCPQGGYNVEVALQTSQTVNPPQWNSMATTRLSYFGPDQTAPARAIIAYQPEGVKMLKAMVRHQGDIWGETVVNIERPLWKIPTELVPRLEKKLPRAVELGPPASSMKK